jgi:hypothetical protein
MVGGAVPHPTASSEPDVKPFGELRAGFSLHPALQKTALVTSTGSGERYHDNDHGTIPDWQGCFRCLCCRLALFGLLIVQSIQHNLEEIGLVALIPKKLDHIPKKAQAGKGRPFNSD